VLVYQKFPLLVLVDLGGTLFYRTTQKEISLPCSFRVKTYSYYLRPGHQDFLLRLYRHPRVRLVFYSSIMLKNITPALDEILAFDLKEVREGLIIYD
jgi:hypothetical protein